MKNEDVLSVQEQALSETEETVKIEELFGTIAGDAQKSENGKKFLIGANLKKHGERSRRMGYRS